MSGGGVWVRRMSRDEAAEWGIEPVELEGHRYRAPEVYLARGDEIRSAGAVGFFAGVLRVDGRIAHVRVAYS